MANRLADTPKVYANPLASDNAIARRNKLAAEMTHYGSQSAGGGYKEPGERLNLIPPWVQTLSGESAGGGFTDSLHRMVDESQYGGMDIGGTEINPLDFVNPVAGTFGGKLAKTADLMKLREAMNQVADGVNPRRVYQDTGWFAGPDGQWRFEIDDSAMYLDDTTMQGSDAFGSKAYVGDARDVIRHERLSEAYPDLLDNPAFVARVGPDGGGSFHPTAIEVGIPEHYGEGLDEGIRNLLDDPIRRSITNHELQHAIQQREGFARGGSPEMFPNYGDINTLAREWADINELPKFTDQIRRYLPSKMGAEDIIYGGFAEQEALGKAVAAARAAAPDKRLFDQARDLWAKHGYPMDKAGIQDALSEINHRMNAPSPMEQYRRLTGEAEARAVQKRMDYSPAQRREIFPLDDYDVPLDELINRYGEGVNEATVWHGSPHKFDRFDLSKIGTGEGAQVYGHGLYLADRQGTGEQYRAALSGFGVTDEARGLIEKAAGDKTIASNVIGLAQDGADMAYEAQKYLSNPPRTLPQETVEAYARAYKEAAKHQVQARGYLYKVDLPDDQIARMLDWDAPLSEQPAILKRAQEMVGDNPEVQEILPSSTGKDLHNSIFPMIGVGRGTAAGYQQDAAADVLRELGIPGIKYFDGGSRSAGQGTRNYVVFDDQIPQILERNGNPLSR